MSAESLTVDAHITTQVEKYWYWSSVWSCPEFACLDYVVRIYCSFFFLRKGDCIKQIEQYNHGILQKTPWKYWKLKPTPPTSSRVPATRRNRSRSSSIFPLRHRLQALDLPQEPTPGATSSTHHKHWKKIGHRQAQGRRGEVYRRRQHRRRTPETKSSAAAHHSNADKYFSFCLIRYSRYVILRKYISFFRRYNLFIRRLDV